MTRSNTSYQQVAHQKRGNYLVDTSFRKKEIKSSQQNVWLRSTGPFLKPVVNKELIDNADRCLLGMLSFRF